MLFYNISEKTEAFSTNIEDSQDFPVTLPLHQAHSAKVRRVPEQNDDITGVDALITNQPQLRIGVKTADCVPILLFDSKNTAIAAIHSGWKGTVQNIISATLCRMSLEFGTNPKDVKAVIGPCIHLEAFEVGDEVYEKFRDELFSSFFPDAEAEMHRFARRMQNKTTGTEKWHIDLPAVCRFQLEQEGVKAENIEVRPECTFTEHTRFYSARHLGKDFGRQRIWNCIMIKS